MLKLRCIRCHSENGKLFENGINPLPSIPEENRKVSGDEENARDANVFRVNSHEENDENASTSFQQNKDTGIAGNGYFTVYWHRG